MTNPFGDTEVTSGNPFGDSLVADGGGNPFGDTEIPPASALDVTKALPDIASIGIFQAASNIKRTFVAPVPDFPAEMVATFQEYPNSPAAQEYFRLKAESDQAAREAAPIAQAMQEATPPGADQTLYGRVATSVAGSLAPSAAGLAAGVITRSPAIGMAVGAPINFGAEAGAIEQEALQEGATLEEARRSAGFGGLAASALEAAQMGSLLKAGKGLKRRTGELIIGEGGTEGATQLLQDTESNLAGYTDRSLGEIAQRSGEAALGGIVGGAIMSPALKGLEYSQKKQAEEMEAGAVAEEQKARAALAASLGQALEPEITPPPQGKPMSPAAMRAAEVQRKQIERGLAVPLTPEQEAIAGDMDAQFSPPILEQARKEALADETGVSAAVYQRQLATYQEDHTPLSKRRVVGHSDPRAVGLELGQLGVPAPGHVTLVASPDSNYNELFSPELQQWLLTNTKSWIDRLAPDMRVILNLEMLNPREGGQRFGAHQRMIINGEQVHVITPKDFPSFGKYKFGDLKTRAGVGLAFSHEFGHALKIQNFFKGIAENLRGQVQQEVDLGAVSPETLAALQGTSEGALLGTWNDMRTRILDGSMTAQEFVENWVGPRKLGAALLRTNPERVDSMAWGREMLAKDGKILEASSALDLVIAAYSAKMDAKGKARSHTARRNSVMKSALSFDEFMAEQFSRASLKPGFFKNMGPAGEAFQKVFNVLRDFFRMLKKDGVVQPHTTFADWLEAQTERAKGMGKSSKIRFTKEQKAARASYLEEVKAAEALAKAEQVAREKKKAEEKGAIVEGPLVEAPDSEADIEETPPAPLVTHTDVGPKESLLATLDRLVGEGIVEDMSPIYRAIKGRIEREEYEAARDLINKKMKSAGVNFDLEYTTRGLQAARSEPVLTKKTLAQIQRRVDLRKSDQLAIQRVMESVKGREPTIDDLEQAVADVTFPLAMEDGQLTHEMVSAGFSHDYGTDRLWGKGGWFLARSLVFTAPFETRPSRQHYANKGYVAHIRAAFRYSKAYLLELQSDLFQHKIEPWTEEQVREELASIEEVRRETTERADLLQARMDNLIKFLEEDRQGPVSANKRNAISISYGTTNRVKLENLLNEMYAERDSLLEMQEGLKAEEAAAKKKGEPVPEYEKLKREQKTWFEGIIQRAINEAGKMGMHYFNFPTVETMVTIQGWPTYWNSALPFSARELPTARGSVTLTGNGRLVKVKDKFGFQAETTEGSWVKVPWEMLSETQSNAILSLRKTAPPHYGRQQPIVDRYLTTIVPHVMLKYKPQETTDSLGNSWLMVNVEQAVGDVVRFDEESPNYDNVEPGQLAGLTPEQMRQPSVVAQAVKLWRERTWNSPFFRRWFGDSKATKYDGEPLQLWHGAGSDLQALQLSPYRATWFHTNRDNAVMDAVLAGWGKKQDPASYVQNYALRMNRPLVKSNGGGELNEIKAKAWIHEAMNGGYDGLIIHDVRTPHLGSLYAVFRPEDAKALLNHGTFDDTDQLHWDADSENQQMAKTGLSRLWPLMKDQAGIGYLKILGAGARTLDAMIQLQQRANTTLPNGLFDEAIQFFNTLTRHAQQMKNSLQYPGERVSKAMQNLPKEDFDLMNRLLTEEWKRGELDTDLEQVPGEFRKTTHVATKRFAERLEAAGLDLDSKRARKIAQLILDYKNAIQMQFDSLHDALAKQIEERWAATPEVMHAELAKLNAALERFQNKPFVPQGRFGDFVLVVKQRVFDEELGKMKWVVVRQEHFQSESARQQAYVKMVGETRGNANLKVSTHNLAGFSRRLALLPSDFLDSLAATGNFSQDQLEELADIMQASRYGKLEERYDRAISHLEGADPDMLRNFSSFIWHNSNFVWKSYYKPLFTRALLWEEGLIREAERDAKENPDLARDTARLVDFRRRNKAIMRRTLESILYPEDEYQTIRFVTTMLYLGYNIKTAMLNFTTQIFTATALTSQYGEATGLKHMAQAYADAMKVPWMSSLIEKAEGKEKARLQDLQAAIDRANREGILDPSYAYFLAGQANGFDMARAFRRNKAGRAWHLFMEVGMFPFRGIEKVNRYHSFLAFYNAEKAAGSTSQAAYEAAVTQTNLTQNSFSPANRPELFRGKKSVAFVFASFPQFVMYHALGGYERQARAIAKSRGRNHAAAWHGETVKLYMLFFVLAGLAGVPFGDDLMNLAQFFWRKVGGRPENLEVELRKLVKAAGMNPDLFMHGLAGDVWGFDLSGSLGLGRLLPFASALGRDYKTFEEALGAGALSATGPVGGLAQDIFKVAGLGWSAAKGAPVTGAEMAKELPGAIGGLGRAFDAAERQRLKPGHGIQTRSGESMVIDQETGRPRDLTEKELIGMALNLQPTVSSITRERNMLENQEWMYWTTRRGMLLDQYTKVAEKTPDKEARPDVLDAINRFNAEVPDYRLKILPMDRQRALRAVKREVREEDTGLQRNLAERRVKGNVRSAFGAAAAPTEPFSD